MPTMIYRGDGSDPVPLTRRKPTRPRDSQKSKVYNAEREAFDVVKHPPRSYKGDVGLRTTNECEIWVGRVLRNRRAKAAVDKATAAFNVPNRWPNKVRVDNSRGAGGARASWYTNTIEVSAYFRTPAILLHELAHLIAPPKVEHGPEFAAIYLALVRAVMGVRDHDRLKAEFKKHRVRFRPKRVISPERKAELVERMRSVRERANTISHAPARSLSLTRDHSVAVAIANSDTSYT